jgi:hypothetical protein
MGGGGMDSRFGEEKWMIQRNKYLEGGVALEVFWKQSKLEGEICILFLDLENSSWNSEVLTLPP